MEMKYKLTEESINYCCRTLYRIEALKDFGNVKKGDKGGYAQSEENLSQEGDCWISDNAEVYGNAEVHGNAWVYDKTKVYDKGEVYDNAKVHGNARVFGNGKVYGDADVRGNTKIGGNTKVSDDDDLD